MATFTITSRIYGPVDFTCRDEGGYVRVHCADLGELDGRQPCDGGAFRGSTLTADVKTLEKVARRWWKQFLARQSELA